MLVVLSPAKNLDEQSPWPQLNTSQPRLLEDAQALVAIAKQLTPAQLSSLMHISDPLAGLNAARFSAFHTPFTEQNARPALFTFNGDVYTGLAADTLDAEAISYAQEHLRILSGLYGVLRPLDLMQAYRLEMGTALATPRGKNLYAFWGDRITDLLQQDLAEIGSDLLINLASTEYFSSVKQAKLKARVITPVFQDEKNGQYKVISFWAKKARGLMARYIMQQRPSDVAELQQFSAAGYRFDAAASTPTELVFKRAEADQAAA